MEKKYWRYVAIVLIVTVAILSYWMITKADYKGKIATMNKNSFYLAPMNIDPEAEYNFPEIHYSGDTVIIGADIQEGQTVKVWVKKASNQITAKKIKILDD
jgi:hypothetical protein